MRKVKGYLVVIVETIYDYDETKTYEKIVFFSNFKNAQNYYLDEIENDKENDNYSRFTILVTVDFYHSISIKDNKVYMVKIEDRDWGQKKTELSVYSDKEVAEKMYNASKILDRSSKYVDFDPYIRKTDLICLEVADNMSF